MKLDSTYFKCSGFFINKPFKYVYLGVRLIILLGFVSSRLWRVYFFAVKGSRGEVGVGEGPGQCSGGNRFEYISPVI